MTGRMAAGWCALFFVLMGVSGCVGLYVGSWSASPIEGASLADQGWTALDGEWRQPGPVFVFDSADSGLLFRPGETYGDVTVEARIHARHEFAEAGAARAGFVLRGAADPEGAGLASGYVAVLRGDGAVSIATADGEVLGEVSTGADPRRQTVPFRAEARGAVLTASVDGHEVLRVEDGRYARGGVGLLAESGELWFRDLRLGGNPASP